MGPSMELRDYFAGQAVVPLLAIYERPDFSYTVTKKETAHRAYEMADAMIEIRASKTEGLAATVPAVAAANSAMVPCPVCGVQCDVVQVTECNNCHESVALARHQ